MSNHIQNMMCVFMKSLNFYENFFCDTATNDTIYLVHNVFCSVWLFSTLCKLPAASVSISCQLLTGRFR